MAVVYSQRTASASFFSCIPPPLLSVCLIDWLFACSWKREKVISYDKTLSGEPVDLLQTDSLLQLSGSKKFRCHVIVRAIDLHHHLCCQQQSCFVDTHPLALLTLATEGIISEVATQGKVFEPGVLSKDGGFEMDWSFITYLTVRIKKTLTL